jgi:phosphoesterase family protein
MSIRDTLKVKEVIREMELGIFPSFLFVALPNDHTFGTKAGKPAPEVMVADNDEAVGLLVEAISKSEYWESTVIFIIQDDAQGKGGDHIHPQRSLCLVVSPWAKTAHTSSVHYSMPSVYRTIEMLFGLPPMNLNTAAAAPMYDVFIDADQTPDTSPYEAITPQVPYKENTAATFMAAESAELNFVGVDEAPGLGHILWHYMKGADVEPPPYAKWNDE